MTGPALERAARADHAAARSERRRKLEAAAVQLAAHDRGWRDEAGRPRLELLPLDQLEQLVAAALELAALEHATRT